MDTVDPAGISVLRGSKSLQPARQLIRSVRSSQFRILNRFSESARTTVFSGIGGCLALHSYASVGSTGPSDGCNEPGTRRRPRFRSMGWYRGRAFTSDYGGRPTIDRMSIAEATRSRRICFEAPHGHAKLLCPGPATVSAWASRASAVSLSERPRSESFDHENPIAKAVLVGSRV